MATFYRLEDGQYINIDQITFISYSKDKNKTIYGLSGLNEAFIAEGNIVEDILNRNSDVSMRDKLTCNYFYNKIRGSFTEIQTRLDIISREVRNGHKRNT